MTQGVDDNEAELPLFFQCPDFTNDELASLKASDDILIPLMIGVHDQSNTAPNFYSDYTAPPQ